MEEIGVLETKLSNITLTQDLSLSDINIRIKREISYDVINELSDENLMEDYIKCKSVKDEIKTLSNILDKHVDKPTNDKILSEYLTHLIPAGTKGVIRGNKFNSIIKKFIIDLSLDNNQFEVCFEKTCLNYITHEIPDWYILTNLTTID